MDNSSLVQLALPEISNLNCKQVSRQASTKMYKSTRTFLCMSVQMGGKILILKEKDKGDRGESDGR